MGVGCTLLCLFIALSFSGCSGSRWARRDTDYATKYPVHSDEPIRVIKQAVDARHVEDKSGTFVGGSYDPFDDAYQAEIGGFGYPESWYEQRLALSTTMDPNLDEGFVGFNGGVRFQSPSRLAPFVGVGVYGGLNMIDILEEAFDDNDPGDPFYDPDDDVPLRGLLAAYPEVGVHWWINTDTRLTGSMSYWLTTRGSKHEYLMFNISLSKLDLGSKPRFDE